MWASNPFCASLMYWPMSSWLLWCLIGVSKLCWGKLLDVASWKGLQLFLECLGLHIDIAFSISIFTLNFFHFVFSVFLHWHCSCFLFLCIAASWILKAKWHRSLLKECTRYRPKWYPFLTNNWFPSWPFGHPWMLFAYGWDLHQQSCHFNDFRHIGDDREGASDSQLEYWLFKCLL